MPDYVYWKLSCSNVREIQIIRSGQEIQKNNNTVSIYCKKLIPTLFT